MNRVIELPDYEVHADIRVDPARTALVIVDMQNDFVRDGGGLLVPDAATTIPAIRALLKLARAHQMRIVYTQDTHRDGDPEWRLWPEHAREGSWGWAIVDELAPNRDDVVGAGTLTHCTKKRETSCPNSLWVTISRHGLSRSASSTTS